MKKILVLAVCFILSLPIWASSPELKALMRRAQPFDRGASLQTSVDAIITTKKGKETLMKYTMYTLRQDGKIQVMIAFSAPNSFDGTRILTVVPEEGGVPGVIIKFKSFFATMRIPFVNSDMSFFGMDFTSGDMNPRNSSFDTYTLLEETTLADGSPCYVVEALPVKDGQYHRMVHYVDLAKEMIVKSEMYDSKGRKVKVMEVLECVPVQGIWSAQRIRMTDLKSGSNTLLTYSNLVYHGDYASYVNTSFLKTGDSTD